MFVMQNCIHKLSFQVWPINNLFCYTPILSLILLLYTGDKGHSFINSDQWHGILSDLVNTWSISGRGLYSIYWNHKYTQGSFSLVILVRSVLCFKLMLNLCENIKAHSVKTRWQVALSSAGHAVQINGSFILVEYCEFHNSRGKIQFTCSISGYLMMNACVFIPQQSILNMLDFHHLGKSVGHTKCIRD